MAVLVPEEVKRTKLDKLDSVVHMIDMTNTKCGNSRCVKNVCKVMCVFGLRCKDEVLSGGSEEP